MSVVEEAVTETAARTVRRVFVSAGRHPRHRLAKPLVKTTQEFLAEGGKIAHIYRGKRVITIAYQPGDAVTPTQRDLSYGASIYTQDPPGPDGKTAEIWNKWTRRNNNQQAVDRFYSAPVTVDDPVVPAAAEHLASGQADYIRRTYLRSVLLTHGVKAR